MSISKSEDIGIMKITSVLILFGMIMFCSCGDNYTPKPKGYFRIDLRKQTYHPIDLNDYPFTFEISSESCIINNDSKKNETPTDTWFDIYYPFYKARIYCTYTPVDREKLKEASEDSYRFVYRHTVKADAINTKMFACPQNRTYGPVYTLTGNVATPVQFSVTDSVKHFFRGALYFDDCTPNQDSLKPVIEYIYNDVFHIIETMQWK